MVLAGSALVVEVPDAYVVQAGMAAGLNTIAIANGYGLDRGLAAGAVVWGTLLVLAAGVGLSVLG